MKAKEAAPRKLIEKFAPVKVIHSGVECGCSPAHGGGVYHHYNAEGKRVRCDCPNDE